MDTVYHFLPNSICNQISQLPPLVLKSMEEIRVRIGRPIEVLAHGIPSFLPYIVKPEDGIQLLNKLSHFSMYTLEEELKRGYITIEGGHRVGLAGKVILDNGKVKSIRDIASFNIRIARQKKGIALPLLPYLFTNNTWQHTMILGPPQTGKTTLLRDLARLLSVGEEKKSIAAVKVGIVDERSEIAGCVNGIPQLEFGHRLDVLDACPKAEGMMMMIRSMSPDVLIVDEIGRPEDSEAIKEAVNAGITLMMTTHGRSFEEIQHRPTLKDILQQGIFTRFVCLSRNHGPGTVTEVLDEHGQQIQLKVGVT